MKQLVIRTFIVTIMSTLSGLSIADNNPAVLKIEGDLSIMVLGSGGPVATAAGHASAGYMIFTDGNPSPRIIMDVGGGTFQRIAQSGTNIADLDMFLLTHLHADHTGDLHP